MVRFLCMFFPPVIAVVLTKKLRKENFTNQQYLAFYTLFALFVNSVCFLILSFMFDPHDISAADVFKTSFSFKYSALASVLAFVSAYGLEYGRRLLRMGKMTGKGQIKGLGHVAIRVKDVEASVKFYNETVGLEEAFRMNNPESGELAAVYMYVAPSQFVEIIPRGNAGWAGTQADNDTVGIKHICIEVENAEAFQEKLRDRGAPIDEDLETGISGCLHFWTHDPDGNKIEFAEFPPESLQAKANARIAGEKDEEDYDDEEEDTEE